MLPYITNNTSPYIPNLGNATKIITGAPVSKGEPTYSSDMLRCKDIAYREKAFVLDGGEWWQNDVKSFLYKKVIATDTIEIKVFKDGVEVATITDDTYGIYYPSFTEQTLYVGCLIEWVKLYNDFGIGIYTVEAHKTILGEEEIEYSHNFDVKLYSDLRANHTVRIETYQTGNILRSPFDYTNLITGGWYQSLRIDGYFGTNIPKLDIDNYMNSSYEVLQIRDKVINEWTLQSQLLPIFISKPLIYDYILANKILISDYNYFNEDIYRRLQVYCKEITNKKEFSGSKNAIFTLKFSDKKEDIIKTN